MPADEGRSSRIAALIPRRDLIVGVGCILGVCALAWAYLVRVQHQMSSAESATAMARMGMVMNAPWHAPDVVFTFTMWAVMMVGMMTPAAAPMLLLVAATDRRREEPGAPITALLFGFGYITVWLGFSACATLAQWGLHNAALLSEPMAVASPRLAGALLIAAGAYQLTPVKAASLEHCQTPMGFLMSHWRNGPAGAFRMGLHHGIYCLGCCWALMCVLFAVGVMNLAWVGALTVFILLERIGRNGRRVAQLGGVMMVALGILRALGI